MSSHEFFSEALVNLISNLDNTYQIRLTSALLLQRNICDDKNPVAIKSIPQKLLFLLDIETSQLQIVYPLIRAIVYCVHFHCNWEERGNIFNHFCEILNSNVEFNIEKGVRFFTYLFEESQTELFNEWFEKLNDQFRIVTKNLIRGINVQSRASTLTLQFFSRIIKNQTSFFQEYFSEFMEVKKESKFCFYKKEKKIHFIQKKKKGNFSK